MTLDTRYQAVILREDLGQTGIYAFNTVTRLDFNGLRNPLSKVTRCR